ncbi:MAG TPA: ethanolamine ammonia-lyase subunit EutC [Candidatus Limnocylindrales bacterium]|nr:ethanolamine ammonia-lyase subunit EutC [Candidatus Limnocylindrales bacterium]
MKTDLVIVSPVAAASLRRFTDARVALGRAGSSLTTKAHLQFVGDHARARDAVWTAVDFDSLAHQLGELGARTVRVRSQAGDRATYLRRPDLGRQLDEESMARLAAEAVKPAASIALVVADGLSAEAIHTQASAVAGPLLLRLATRAPSLIVLVEQGRVAIGDAIGEALGAELVIVLVGERPGLSAADSLGCYVTWSPRTGTPDSRRNCISNIRGGGLAPEAAAEKIAALVERMFERRMSGVGLL